MNTDAMNQRQDELQAAPVHLAPSVVVEDVPTNAAPILARIEAKLDKLLAIVEAR